MTSVSLRGIRRSVAGATLCQSKVLTATRIITATRAAMGMRATRPPRATTSTSKNTPDRKVDRRVRAPDFTLIMVWPIMAQPPMPPKKPVTMFATPWPQDSRVLSEWCR